MKNGSTHQTDSHERRSIASRLIPSPGGSSQQYNTRSAGFRCEEKGMDCPGCLLFYCTRPNRPELFSIPISSSRSWPCKPCTGSRGLHSRRPGLSRWRRACTRPASTSRPCTRSTAIEPSYQHSSSHCIRSVGANLRSGGRLGCGGGRSGRCCRWRRWWNWSAERTDTRERAAS